MSLQPDHTIGAALAIMAARLDAADVEAPRQEARLLACAVLKLDHAGLILREARLLGEASDELEAFLLRRCGHEPLSRILCQREFFGLNLHLNTATLDPRPDTETLVEVILARLAGESPSLGSLRLLDLGTGTGAILLAVLSRLPAACGVGIDLTPAAVEMARENARRLALDARASFRIGDMFKELEGTFDVIASNPPYIASGVIAELEPEVRLFDPVLALDGGVDGLDFYRRIASDAPHHLMCGGLLALEVGAGQAADVAALIEDAGLLEIRIDRDLGGIERVVSARKG